MKKVTLTAIDILPGSLDECKNDWQNFSPTYIKGRNKKFAIKNAIEYLQRSACSCPCFPVSCSQKDTIFIGTISAYILDKDADEDEISQCGNIIRKEVGCRYTQRVDVYEGNGFVNGKPNPCLIPLNSRERSAPADYNPSFIISTENICTFPDWRDVEEYLLNEFKNYTPINEFK